MTYSTVHETTRLYLVLTLSLVDRLGTHMHVYILVLYLRCDIVFTFSNNSVHTCMLEIVHENRLCVAVT